MSYTDGLIVRCGECGSLNVVLNPINPGDIKKCLSCESRIVIYDAQFMYKTDPGLIK